MRDPGIRSGLAVALAFVVVFHAPAAGQSPSPEAVPELDAALAAVELMNAVPEGIRETCMPSSVEMDGVVASAQCLHGEGLVLYVRFDEVFSLQAGYDALAVMTGLAPDTGTDCADGAFEGETTTADGSPTGRLVCQEGPDGPMAMWIDVEPLVLGVVQLMGDSDFAALDEAWQAARTDAQTSAAASPTPAATASPSQPIDAVELSGVTGDPT